MVAKLTAALRNQRVRVLLLGGILGAALLLPNFLKNPYFLHILIQAMLFAYLGQAWNILGGFAGQLSLGHTVYFGVGAYTSTFLLVEYGVNPWIGLLTGALVAALFGVLVGYPTFRLKGRYFVMASIALLVLVQTVLLNIERLGAASGLLAPLRPDSLLHLQFSQKAPYYYLVLAFLIVITALVYWIEHSKIGYYFRTIHEDEDIAAGLGVNTTLYKLIAMAMSASFTAVGGTLYAQYVLFIDPLSVVSLDMAFLIALLVILGGAGTTWGALVGAAILIPLSELSSAMLGGEGQGIDLIIFGLMIVIIGIYQPEGIIGALRKASESDDRAVEREPNLLMEGGKPGGH